MRYYFAPLEGITGYIYRRAHHAFYPGADRYFTPFIVPKEKRHLSAKERNDVLPEHNPDMTVIPQIMTNRADEFLRVAHILREDYGYAEVNLNLGCPSRTVVSKKRGAGFLAVPEQLDAFLDEVASGLGPVKLSVKTRIGMKDPEEFSGLLEIFAKYPLSELIVHPRVQADLYGNAPDLETFSETFSINKDWKICYNGDIRTAADAAYLAERFPQLDAVMAGRGLLTDPALIGELKVGENGGWDHRALQTAETKRFFHAEAEKDERKRRYEFYRMILSGYKEAMDGERNVLFKMKELWLYMCRDFTEPQRYWKKMKKAQRLCDFQSAVDALFREQRLLEYGEMGEQGIWTGG